MLPAMAAGRCGFTLVEILISIMIFVVVSGAMIGILLIGTDLFRRGEFSRAANDETVAVVGTIEDDIKHMVPAADGGWLYAEVVNGAGSGWANGDCILAFLITNPDSSLIQHDGSFSRLKVAYGCYQGRIQRATAPLVTTIQDPQGIQDIAAFVQSIPSYLNGSNTGAAVVPGAPPAVATVTSTTVTSGCLYFGVSLLINGNPTYPPPTTSTVSGSIDWEAPLGACTVLPPWAGQAAYDTSMAQPLGQANMPMPSVLRLSLVLTGGSRFAPRGQVIADNGTTLRINGLSALPTAPGSMLRVDAAGGGSTEWIGYSAVTTSITNGTVISCPSPRSLRRTTTTTHNRGDLVQVGQTYSIVRTLPQ
jgi:prepilin-type N-terminal cleavage/methylation domain-containing protein